MPDAREVPVSPFFHQIDRLGVYNSICRVCYQTVAHDPRLSRLVEGEEDHQCAGSPRSPASKLNSVPPSNAWYEAVL